MDLSFEGVARLVRFLGKTAKDTYPESPSPIHNEITRQQLPALLDKYPISLNAEILDVGCGQGPALDLLRDLGFSPTGITINGEDLETCRQKGHRVLDMDQSFLEFPEGVFDLIWARHVVEHSVFPFFTLTEFFRVMKPGGLLYLEVPAPETSCHHETNKNHYSVFSVGMWASLLARTGFSIQEHITMNFTTGAGPDEYWAFVAKRPPSADQ